ncbi:hypothetical protein QOL99_09530 [Deinococcus sp. MIMF12]|uniref:DUF4402 domain-containing protein n=1 Tax=Deinococcus rhizophilus TaxID=3049544 RepID=A0ABT7JH68_9DEIO|nr:hypothetical protein [Deinococcus rhizophilus]MDL2344394.1 hypothetical protein [Deinococcus rhizophilus]
MKQLAAVALAALLASCAPAFTAAPPGRVVNAATGQEGTVTFAPGSLRPGLPATGADNVALSIGGQTYMGRATVLDGSLADASAPLSLSVAVGGTAGTGGTTFGWGARLGPAPQPQGTLRAGSLIARTAGPGAAGTGPRTLTCTLTVDDAGRGFGECRDEAGVRYVLQF